MSSDSAYAQSGVDIAAGHRATQLMKAAVEATHGPEVLASIGAFGGLFDAAGVKGLNRPILVASTDGVGTKTKVASALGRWDTIGHDIVNHCVNDILVQGARPLFFLDYIASSKLDPVQFATVVSGAAAACRENGCALLGGESAEMPGVYQAGELDLVGTVVGVVDRADLIDGSRIQPGDIIMGLPSSGPHTNGYTLLRRVLDGLDWHALHSALGQSIGDAILAPHRSYLADIMALKQAGVALHGLAHITGGGIVDNLPRVLPAGCGAQIARGSWPVRPIFDLIQTRGDIPLAEMFHVFNMGLGMLVVVPPHQRALVEETLADVYTVGAIVAGPSTVEIV